MTLSFSCTAYRYLILILHYFRKLAIYWNLTLLVYQNRGCPYSYLNGLSPLTNSLDGTSLITWARKPQAKMSSTSFFLSSGVMGFQKSCSPEIIYNDGGSHFRHHINISEQYDACVLDICFFNTEYAWTSLEYCATRLIDIYGYEHMCAA